MRQEIEYVVSTYDDGGVFIRACIGGIVVGQLTADPPSSIGADNSGVLIRGMNVNKQYRRQGVATAMVRMLKNTFPHSSIYGIPKPQEATVLTQHIQQLNNKLGITSLSEEAAR